MKKYFLILLTILIFSSISYSQWLKVESGLPELGNQSRALSALDGSVAIISITLPPPTSTLYKTNDGGQNWYPLTSPTGNILTDISIIAEDQMFVCNMSQPPAILGSNDNGLNWQTLFDATQITSFLNYLEMFDLNNGMVMGDALDTNSPVAFINTVDGGQNWISVNNLLLGGSSGNVWTRIDFINSDIGYFFDSHTQKLFKTVNGGLDWLELSGFPPVSPMVIKFYDENIGLALQTYANKVFRTFDGGVTWDTVFISTSSYGSDIEFLHNDPSKIWIATVDELFFSSDAGVTWQLDPLSGNFENGIDLEIADGVGWFLCETVYRNENVDRVSEVVDEDEIYPRTIKLMQNYPNPFNPSTMIEFSLPEYVNHVKLSIYSTLGEKVAELVNAALTAGNYQFRWNAKNLATGIYMYELRTENFRAVKKMFLLK